MSRETLNNSFQSKVINFIKKNLKKLVVLFIFIIFILFSYFIYNDFKKKKEIKLSQEYIEASIQFKNKNKDESKKLLENIIFKKHKFYSPLALYFIIDNNLETETSKIIIFYDKILSISSIDQENLDLIKIKKSTFLFKTDNEKLIIETLNPVINSDSVWRNMAIKLMSDYFLSKNQKTKANEYIQLLNNKIKK